MCVVNIDSFSLINMTRVPDSTNVEEQVMTVTDSGATQVTDSSKFSVEVDFSSSPKTFTLVITTVECQDDGSFTVTTTYGGSQTDSDQFGVDVLGKIFFFCIFFYSFYSMKVSYRSQNEVFMNLEIDTLFLKQSELTA